MAPHQEHTTPRRFPHSVPRPLRRLLRPFQRLYRIYEELRPVMWIGEKQRDELEQAAAASVLCVADTKHRAYLFGQVLSTNYSERCVGRAWLWNITRVARSRGCAAISLHIHPRFHKFLRRETWFCVPKWVGAAVDIPLSPCVLHSKTVRDDLRKIRRNAFGFDVTRDIRDLEDFYWNMYVPYIQRVHADRAFIMSFGAMHEAFEQGELLRVTDRGVPIAATFIRHSDAGPRAGAH